LREFLIINTRYAIILIKIKERGIASIEKERYIIFIVTEFYIKLSVCSHVRKSFRIFINYIDRRDTSIVNYFEICDNLFRSNSRRLSLNNFNIFYESISERERYIYAVYHNGQS
jgi:hypothetical protein